MRWLENKNDQEIQRHKYRIAKISYDFLYDTLNWYIS